MFWQKHNPLVLKVDLHSHLIPGVDDGVKTLDESVALIQEFVSLGYTKLITTPHISESYFPNSVTILKEGHAKVQLALREKDIQIEFQLGAEYMIDGSLLAALKEKEELLSWDGHLLVESSFHNKPMILDETFYEIQSLGLLPVYAHPERYPYFFKKWDELATLRARGILFQINIGSFAGLYGPEVKKMANGLLKRGMIDFLASDAHGNNHMEYLRKGLACKALRNLSPSDFRNHELLT